MDRAEKLDVLLNALSAKKAILKKTAAGLRMKWLHERNKSLKQFFQLKAIGQTNQQIMWYERKAWLKYWDVQSEVDVIGIAICRLRAIKRFQTNMSIEEVLVDLVITG